MAGVKFDKDKLPLHLIPPEALYALACILKVGAAKYHDRNWEEGLSWSRCYRAALNHLWLWFIGAPADKDSGQSHLWHVLAEIVFLVVFELRETGTDDRPPVDLPDWFWELVGEADPSTSNKAIIERTYAAHKKTPSGPTVSLGPPPVG